MNWCKHPSEERVKLESNRGHSRYLCGICGTQFWCQDGTGPCEAGGMSAIVTCVRCSKQPSVCTCDELHIHSRSTSWMHELGYGDLCGPTMRERLDALLEGFTEHEVGAVLFVAQRLAHGRTLYGPLNPFDGRDWLTEGAEEVADTLVYFAAETMRRNNGDIPRP